VQVTVSPGGSPLTGVTAVSAGGSHSLALKDDGTVWAWGYNNSGPLGNGKLVNSSVPVQVMISSSVALTDVKAISAGEFHSMALMDDGTIMAWGSNGDGRLGRGDNGGHATYAVPVLASGTTPLTDVKAVASGGEYSLALMDNETVMAWGKNGSGQLGDETTADKYNPVQVKISGGAALTGVKEISAGFSQSFALMGDGTVVAWGNNFFGQLGDGTNANKLFAVSVIGLTMEVKSMSAGRSHSLALMDDGTVMAWGGNEYGQLGLGDGDDRGHPVPVVLPASLSGAATISDMSPRIGDTLTASLVDGNDTGTLSYQWKVGGANAGTGSTYTVVTADLGETVTVEIRSSVEVGMLASSATSAVAKKAAPTAPAAPTVASKSQTGVTLTAIAGCEYRLGGGEWQSSNAFSGLTANTAYQLYQRVAETGDTLPSASSPVLSVTTDAAQATPVDAPEGDDDSMMLILVAVAVIGAVGAAGAFLLLRRRP
jgi:hypothetical protein